MRKCDPSNFLASFYFDLFYFFKENAGPGILAFGQNQQNSYLVITLFKNMKAMWMTIIFHLKYWCVYMCKALAS